MLNKLVGPLPAVIVLVDAALDPRFESRPFGPWIVFGTLDATGWWIGIEPV